jgi:CRP-like cAMP-binding protein
MSLHHISDGLALGQHPGITPGHADSRVFVRRLNSLYPLRAHEIQAAYALLGPAHAVPPYHIILEDRQTSNEALVLLEGMACHYKLLDTGRRQMTGLVVPGDLCDHGFLSSSPPGQCVMSLGPAVVAGIDLDQLSEVADKLPNIVVAAMRGAAVDRACAREMVVSLGARDAVQRLAHLLCELHVRLSTVGVVTSGAHFELPMTQAEIGEALGLSTVHVNRTIQQLRRRKLIAMAQRTVAILDISGLAAVAAFDGRYLRAD